jgi:predicted dehydrogenase
MKPGVPLRLAGIGCGGRTRTYMSLASRLPELYQIAGAADPVASRIDLLEKECGSPARFRRFISDTELLAAEKFADVMIIGTQDALHADPCIAAMEKGYDILLEKPIATTPCDILKIQSAAERLGRKVLVCHVLRYTPFYRKAREIVESGLLGEIVSINATEGVGDFHQAHSYVRGHWSVVEKATPMIIAKCCHDLDIILWLMRDHCTRVASFGGLHYFNQANAPAGAPARCTDGCPHAKDCRYDAHLYIEKYRDSWLSYIYDKAASASKEEILDWLSKSNWGRCVYNCDNTAVDRQVVAMEFQRGGTATLTMTAFENGRHLEIFGTKGVLRGGEAVRSMSGADMILRIHGKDSTTINLDAMEGGYDGHGGGDMGLVLALHDEMSREKPAEMTSSLAVSVESHLIGFAAEASRQSGCVQKMTL